MLLPTLLPPDAVAEAAARAHLDQLTKPPGSLGRLEPLAAQWCAVTGFPAKAPDHARLYTFAADHGVTEEGVSPYPGEVTAQMVRNFLAGGAAVNAFARHHRVELVVVDAGVAAELGALEGTAHAGFLSRRVRRGTGNMRREPAMSREDAEAAVEMGIAVAIDAAAEGVQVLGAGEMGIGNTTAAAACLSAVAGMPGKLTVGRGSGVDDAGLRLKATVVDDAITRHRPDRGDAIGILAAVGGLEIGAIAGLCLGGASRRVPVVVDGFIATAGAMLASVLDPVVLPYVIISHRSAENAHWAMSRMLGKEPILDLDLRLGEGTGAVLGIDALRLAVKVMTQMASFAHAGVSERLA